MKVLHSIAIGSILALSYSIVTMAIESGGNTTIAVSQNSVTVTTGSNREQTQSTTISVDRADLSQPHILRVQGSGNMQRVSVKINGKLVKSIANSSLELNLAPMMTAGRYEVEISGNSARSNDTISVNFNGKNTNVMQQFSGSGTIKQTLVINVQ
jgi:hypothetical protein